MSEELYVLMKRGLYYRPDSLGYTGIRDHAGRYTRDEITNLVDGVTALKLDEAPEYSPNCFSDVKADHIAAKMESLLSLLTASQGRAEAAEARVGELEKLCKEAADLYGQGGTFPVDGVMSERLRNAARTHAEALLNPDLWRPISEMTDELRDGRPIEFCDVRDTDWFVSAKFNADATMPNFPWYTEDGISYQEASFTHFRELKGPGQ